MKISKSKLLKKVAYVLLCVLLCSVLAFGTYAKYALNLSTDGSFTANVYSKYSIIYKNIVNGVDQHFYGNNSGAVGNQTFNIKNAENDGEMRTYGESAIYLPYTWDVTATLSNAQKLTGGELLGWSEFMPGEQKQSTIIGEQYHIREGGGADGQGTKDRTLYAVWQKELVIYENQNSLTNLLNTENVGEGRKQIAGTGISNFALGIPANHTACSSQYSFKTNGGAVQDVSGFKYFEFDLYIPESAASALETLKKNFPGAFHIYLGSQGSIATSNNYKARWNIAPFATNLKVGYNHIVLPLSKIDYLTNEGINPIDLTKVNYFSFDQDIAWGEYNENGVYKSFGGLKNPPEYSTYFSGCVISGIKFTTVANDAPKALGESDYTTGIDAVMAKQAVHYIEYGEMPIHSTKIPTDGKYYSGVTSNVVGDYSGKTPLEGGASFPTPQYGDVYVYGDYEYRYNRTATSDHYWNSSNNNLGGWGVIILNQSKVSYGQVLWEIADKPIISLNFAFGDADNLGRAPEVPPSVTSMYRAFNHCDEMLTAPQIPEGVLTTHGCFSDCYALREPSNIPSTVSGTDGMSYMFYDCNKLLYAPKAFPTNSSVTSMDRMFWNCQSIKEYPTIPEQITNMHSTFANNLALETAPNIPTKVVNMHSTFNRCEKITTVGTIPATVVDLGATFYRCMNLHGDITINATNLQSWSSAFELAGCSFTYDKWTGEIDYSKGVTKTYPDDPIKIVGSSSNDIKQKLASTNSYGTVTY